MSGIEVIGLVMGAIPLVVQGLKAYQSGLKSIGSGFRKRKTVDKLCHKLQFQAHTIELLVAHLLLHSGCAVPGALVAQNLAMLNDPDIQPDIVEYLDHRYDSFVSILVESNSSLQYLASKIVKLIPEQVFLSIALRCSYINSVQKSTALQAMIDGNNEVSKGQLSFRARFSVILSTDSLNEDCAELEKCIDAMDRFLRLITSNQQHSGVQPSRKSKRVAKSLWRIRDHVNRLYKAISTGWEQNCHQQHEAKLRLEGRLSTNIVTRTKARDQVEGSLHKFELVFAGDVPKRCCLWHETSVHVLEQSANDPLQDAQVRQPKVKLTVAGPPHTREQQLVEIQGICSAVQQAQTNHGHAMFILLATSRFARPEKQLDHYRSCEAKSTTHLADILKKGSNSQQQLLPSPSWAARTSLALVVASNFLQLLQTPWAGPKLSSTAISFLHNANHQPDFKKPVISIPFDPTPTAAPAAAPVPDALLELGIMLLEIWCTTTLCEQFSLGAEPTGRQRQMHALDWHEQAAPSLPESYSRPVFQCISGIRGAFAGKMEWDDMKLWESVCELVIEPLKAISEI